MLLKSLMVFILLCLAFMLGIWFRDQREMMAWYEKSNALKTLESVLPPKREVDVERMIVVSQPVSEEFVAHSFELEGKARGYFYEDGSFPLTIHNENGVVLETVSVRALGDWQTPDFVPFKQTISIPYYSGKAKLILKKANPSGLEENDASLVIPITVQ